MGQANASCRIVSREQLFDDALLGIVRLQRQPTGMLLHLCSRALVRLEAVARVHHQSADQSSGVLCEAVGVCRLESSSIDGACAIVRVHQSSVIQINSHSVDGKITTQEIVFNRKLVVNRNVKIDATITSAALSTRKSDFNLMVPLTVAVDAETLAGQVHAPVQVR